MSILQEILMWSQGLPAWQSDAIARLFGKPSLSQQDVEDLYALLKTEHGIFDPDARVAKRLKADQIPAAPSSGSPITLLALKNLQNVNAIAENQRLPFSDMGLTIIYGDNGSGKSGYSRVLKRACRARDQSEPIHPKATLPAGQGGTPQATFEVNINGATSDLLWVDGKPAPTELSRLAVFDSRCARAYLDDEDDYAYVPYGLDILQGLAKACNQLEALIKAELLKTTPDTSSFDDLEGKGTAVSNLIAGLSSKTKPDKVQSLATLSAKEIARKDQLEQSLKADNPRDKATHLRLLAARISKVAQNVDQKSVIVNDENVTRLRTLAEADLRATEAAKVAAQVLINDKTLVPGTGGDVWKKLFEAARNFHAEGSQTELFTEFQSDMQCPLCQQTLGEAAARLNRFEKFVQDETEKNARASKRKFEEAFHEFSSRDLSVDLDKELEAELETKVSGLGVTTRVFGEALLKRHNEIREASKSQVWTNIETTPASPAMRLQELLDSLIREANSLEAAADETARLSMETEFKELDARQRLGRVRAAVLAAIENMDVQVKLNKCLKAVKTTSISNKVKELAASVISKELETALNKEFKSLGADNLKVSLQSRSSKGRTLHKLKLGDSQTKSPADVLSEGEQRAIAIGSFLAEVNIGGGSGGVVFDDPVSSLDHKRREKVANRLVQEALKRQVVVFTHDVYFVSVLVDEAQRIGAKCLTQSLIKKPEGYGVADPRLPFEVMKTSARVGELRDTQQKIAKVYKDGDEQEHRKQTFDAYQKLRFAWERAVEEVLFQNVVIRFRKGVSTQSLAGVSVEDSDYSVVEAGMTKCSNYAHDQALLGGTLVPEPDELLADINALEEWRKEVDDRTKALAKKRKARNSPH